MRKLLAIGLSTVLVMVALAQWHAYRAAASHASASQIFIHGTPVCVFEEGGEIKANVGECPEMPGAGEEAPLENAPFHGRPGMILPPGHPPIDRDMSPDGPRTIPI